MKSVIDTLFFSMLEAPEKSFSNEFSQEENELYEKIKGFLTEEQKKLFLRFDNLKSERHLEESRKLYSLGFQAGAQTVFEMLNMNFIK